MRIKAKVTLISFLDRDGLSAVREIRKMEESGELPPQNLIFALTGNAREGQIRSALDAGMDDVIVRISLFQYILLLHA